MFWWLEIVIILPLGIGLREFLELDDTVYQINWRETRQVFKLTQLQEDAHDSDNPFGSPKLVNNQSAKIECDGKLPHNVLTGEFFSMSKVINHHYQYLQSHLEILLVLLRVLSGNCDPMVTISFTSYWLWCCAGFDIVQAIASADELTMQKPKVMLMLLGFHVQLNGLFCCALSLNVDGCGYSRFLIQLAQ